MGALLESWGRVRKVQWYGEVSRRGFAIITEKPAWVVNITRDSRNLQLRTTLLGSPLPFRDEVGEEKSR